MYLIDKLCIEVHYINKIVNFGRKWVVGAQGYITTIKKFNRYIKKKKDI